MLTIFKYPLQLEPGHLQKISMPSLAKILSCQMQHGLPTLWAAVDPHHLIHENREFLILGTGFPYDEQLEAEFIATVQEGHYVWHVFEIPKIGTIKHHQV